MKKIFTIILAAAGTIGAASAQSINQKSIPYKEHSKMSNERSLKSHHTATNTLKYKNENFSKEKAAKSETFNHKNDQKIAFEKNNQHGNGRQKTKQIQMLQNQRKNEMNKVKIKHAKSSHHTASKSVYHQSHK